jgi:hypothetical protein
MAQNPADWNFNFTDGGYTYEDAEALGKYWGETTWDTKLRIGSLLLGGNDIVIQKALKTARRQ